MTDTTIIDRWGVEVPKKERKKRAPKPGQRQAITRDMVTARPILKNNRGKAVQWEVTLKQGGKRLGTITRQVDWRGVTYRFERSAFLPLFHKRSTKNDGATQLNLAVIALIGGK